MILDSSAVVAVLAGEPEAAMLVHSMADAPRLAMSAATALETSLVGRSGRASAVNAWIREIGVEIVPFDAQQLFEAQIAHARFGRGSGSLAKLNFGDCMSYALAKVTGEPLLFKGDGFIHTDITSGTMRS